MKKRIDKNEILSHAFVVSVHVSGYCELFAFDTLTEAIAYQEQQVFDYGRDCELL